VTITDSRLGTLRITLVGCSAAKLTRPAPARDLYTGDLFGKARALAEATSDRWYILSAKHHLVHPDQVLAPYDQQMPTHVQDAKHWADLVDSNLRCNSADLTTGSFHGMNDPDDRIGLGAWLMSGRSAEVTLLAGAAYCQYLVPYLERLRITLHRPLVGLGIGQQKSRLVALLQAASAHR
jgi:hypothetical protein